MLVLIFHGSRDENHNRQAAEFARLLGASVAFLEREPRFRGEGLGIPVFVADGGDYRRALEAATVKVPPLVRWPGFREYLTALGASLYLFHGPDVDGSIAALRLPTAFLEGRPSLGEAPCVDRVAPVVLTRGFIYGKMERLYASRCGVELLPPLLEQPGFPRFFREGLRALAPQASRYLA